MSELNVDGVTLSYREAGQGPAVVLLHGFTGNSRNWALQIRPLVEGGFRTVSPDLRGHGLSGRPEDPGAYAITRLAADIVALADHLGLDRFFLAGHSMGGMVAQEVALVAADRVRGLVLVDTSHGPFDLADRARREELVRIAREQGMEAVFEYQFNHSPLASVYQQMPEENVRVWRQEFVMTAPAAYVGGQAAMTGRRDTLPRLATLAIPALVVVGSGDTPFVEPSQRMAAALPQGELRIIEGAGHSPMFEAPGEFTALLLEFLRRAAGA